MNEIKKIANGMRMEAEMIEMMYQNPPDVLLRVLSLFKEGIQKILVEIEKLETENK